MLISPIYKSIVRSIVDLIEEIKLSTGNQAILYHHWESRADENKLPAETLIGLDGFNFEENKGLWIVRFAIGISSFKDANLLNEIEMIDIVHEHTGEGKKFRLLDMNSGNQVSELVTAAWQLSPMAQSELRNYRMISIEALRTST